MTATLNVGQTQTATAKVQDANGQPIAGRAVTFTVQAGPDKGKTGVVVTDASGQAAFSYVGDGGAGTDEVQATFVDASGKQQTSNVALRVWTAVVANPVAVCQDVTRPVGDTCSVDVMPAEVGGGSSDPDGDPLALAISPAGPFTLGATPVVMTASDPSGLSATCSATVTAVDTTAPVVVVPAAASATCAPASGAPVAFAVSASDNCSAIRSRRSSSATRWVRSTGRRASRRPPATLARER